MGKLEVLVMLKNPNVPLVVPVVETLIVALSGEVERSASENATLTQTLEMVYKTLGLAGDDRLGLKERLVANGDMAGKVVSLEAALASERGIVMARREQLVNKIVGRMEIVKPGNTESVDRFRTRSASMSFEELDAELGELEATLRLRYNVPRITTPSEALGEAHKPVRWLEHRL